MMTTCCGMRPTRCCRSSAIVLWTPGAGVNALNEKLRDDYIRDSVAGVGRWNRIIQKAGIAFELTVPHKAFNRKIGPLAGLKIAPDGRVVSGTDWSAKTA